MSFFENHLGEFAALLTAVFWTITSLSFESASHRRGSGAIDASFENWIWLSLSGLIGFVFGDLFLFKSYTMIGSRFSMLIMTLVPPITALTSFVILGEKMTLYHYLGMMLTFSGIAMAIFSRQAKGEKLSLKLSPRGILYAFGGAVGQALGLVLSKFGMKEYDPFAATQIRIIAGIIGYAILVTGLVRWRSVIKATGNRDAMLLTSLGAFFGPFLGVSFSLIAVKYTEAGIASTIMALVPVFIIIPAVFLYKQKVTVPELIGSVLSVAGVSIMFL
jgi:drug/metabolite transporter (DMT)-like permease